MGWLNDSMKKGSIILVYKKSWKGTKKDMEVENTLGVFETQKKRTKAYLML